MHTYPSLMSLLLYTIYTFMTPCFFNCNSSIALRLSDSVLESESKVDQSKDSDQAQQARQWLSTLDSSWNGRSSQNDGGKEGELDAIRLAITDSKTTEYVLKIQSLVFGISYIRVKEGTNQETDGAACDD